MREASTYRAARRNASRGFVWHGAKAVAVYHGHPPVRLNRSRRWKPMKSYAEARAFVEANVLAGAR